MPFRFYFYFIVTSLLFLFYPGQHPYFQIIAFNREYFSQQHKTPSISIHPIPYVNSSSLPSITAQGSYIVDISSFTPIYKKNSDSHLFPASTTKIITALVAADIFQPDDVITVLNVNVEGQKMDLVEGEHITAENLLYGMLVYSGNDAAYALANFYGYDEFIVLMNKKAQDLGMKGSFFTNPAGFDDYKQKSTAFDLALAGRALIENPYLRKMVGTKEITISDTDYSIFHKLTNVNKLLGEIQGLGGLKTGYTENAGENLVSFYRHNGHDYLIVVMHSEDRFFDTTTLVDWIGASVQYVTPQI
ncbi:MAG: serine hydrolase [Candidatus Roizmanbacteria bacterium]|nr:serine hydrolase [Candidatus Roizmanbacteria bacterium]